jgi:hypothetical protein
MEGYFFKLGLRKRQISIHSSHRSDRRTLSSRQASSPSHYRWRYSRFHRDHRCRGTPTRTLRPQSLGGSAFHTHARDPRHEPRRHCHSPAHGFQLPHRASVRMGFDPNPKKPKSQREEFVVPLERPPRFYAGFRSPMLNLG